MVGRSERGFGARTVLKVTAFRSDKQRGNRRLSYLNNFVFFFFKLVQEMANCPHANASV